MYKEFAEILFYVKLFLAFAAGAYLTYVAFKNGYLK
jgi:hypothetical protein